jgi:putative pyruvate formate lyase activating enzyme
MGSGAMFFSGCPLGCVYCQNSEISHLGNGKDISATRLSEIIRELEDCGVHNINLITGGHFAPIIAKALETRPAIPVVWNSSGYERIETLILLEGKVQIYLPDLKYSDDLMAARYSNAPDYFEIATKAILEMYRQTGPYRLDEQGIMKSGVIIRHLILPNAIKNSYGVLKWISDNFAPGEVMLSLMSQYTPCGELENYPEIDRKISKEEYQTVENMISELGIEDGYVQDLQSAEDSYIPDFNLKGV